MRLSCAGFSSCVAMTGRWRICLAALCLVIPAAAGAWGDAAWGYSYDYVTDALESDRMWRLIQQQSQKDEKGNKKPSESAPKRSPLDLGDVGNMSSGQRLSDTRAPEMLASRIYERENFIDRSHMFQKLIVDFNLKVAPAYGIPPNNLASGMAVALAGAWTAYKGQVFPDAYIKPLEQQLEKVMQENEKIKSMRVRDKVFTYQTLVGMGMWLFALQQELQKKPNIQEQARMKAMGDNLLKSLLGVPPERVSFTSSGMEISQ